MYHKNHKVELPYSKRYAILVRDDFRCLYCGAKLSIHKTTIDHVFARHSGGPNALENYITACKSHNSSKQDKTVEEFALKLAKEKAHKVIWDLMESHDEEWCIDPECEEIQLKLLTSTFYDAIIHRIKRATKTGYVPLTDSVRTYLIGKYAKPSRQSKKALREYDQLMATRGAEMIQREQDMMKRNYAGKSIDSDVIEALHDRAEDAEAALGELSIETTQLLMLMKKLYSGDISALELRIVERITQP